MLARSGSAPGAPFQWWDDTGSARSARCDRRPCGGRRNGFADNELFVACRFPRGEHAHQVPAPVLPPEYEIFSSALEGFLKDLGIGGSEIGWCQHVEHLASRELDDCLIRGGDATHARRSIVPPPFSKEKRLRHQVERRALPQWRCEAAVLRLWLDHRPGVLAWCSGM